MLRPRPREDRPQRSTRYSRIERAAFRPRMYRSQVPLVVQLWRAVGRRSAFPRPRAEWLAQGGFRWTVARSWTARFRASSLAASIIEPYRPRSKHDQSSHLPCATRADARWASRSPGSAADSPSRPAALSAARGAPAVSASDWRLPESAPRARRLAARRGRVWKCTS